MYFLTPQDDFPPVDQANDDGFLAVTSELTVDRIKMAYYRGIFPWYNEGQPVLWWSPDPRMVLFPSELKIAKSMRSYLNQEKYRVTYDQNFDRVIGECGSINRKGQYGTWITAEIRDKYQQLFEEGLVRSVEVWKEEELVGGLYGVFLEDKKMFCGESMFSKSSNASKFGFIKFVQKLQQEGIEIIDCQIYTDHLASLGAREIPRSEFLKYLQ